MLQNYEIINISTTEKRRIFKPRENLKLYHKFLNLFIFEYLPINERAVFSYRKGFGAFHAVEKHKHSRYFFQTDIKSFFESIDGSLTKKTILAGVDVCPVSDILEYIDRILEMVCIDDSLPVGFPASAPLSNSVLFEFDNEMERVCKGLDFVYSRYADDIIISGQRQDNISGLADCIQEKLHLFASPSLYIHRGKTRFF
jgi:RNA-directed DNA polymerase